MIKTTAFNFCSLIIIQSFQNIIHVNFILLLIDLLNYLEGKKRFNHRIINYGCNWFDSSKTNTVLPIHK